MKSKSKTFKTASIVFFVLGVIYLGVWFFAKSIINSDKICHENKCFTIEIADTDKKRQLGLMNRKHLSKNKGMLFVFNEQKRHTFWMKNTLIPLDMVRIDSDLKIVDIQTAQPCDSDICETYVPIEKSLYVLEISAGLTQKFSIFIGDNLEIK